MGERFASWGDPEGNLGKLSVLRITAERGEKLPKDPFLIKKAIKNYLGADVEGGFPEANGEFFALKVRNNKHIETLKRMKQFCGVNVKVEDHPTHNFSRCKVTCLNATHYTDDGLQAELEDQGVTAVKQFTKKINGAYVPTGTFIITVKGTAVPTHLNFGYNRVATRTYYPNPLLCFNCYEFGHTKTRCPNTFVCGNCSDSHPPTPDNPCSRKTRCKRCDSDNHAISSRKCPVYTREEAIQHIRIDNNLSYSDAKRIYEQENNESTVASVIRTGYEEQLRELTKKLDALLVDVGRKDAQIATLTKQNIKLQTMLKENLAQQKQSQDANKPIMQTQTPSDSQPAITPYDDLNKPTPLSGTITKKQAQKLRKALREKEELEAKKKEEQDKEDYTAAHSKIQRTGSNSDPIITPTSIDDIDISDGSYEQMDGDFTISSGEEDPLAKQL